MPKIPFCQKHLPTLSPELLTVVTCFAAGICWTEILHVHSEFLLYSILLLLGLLFIIYKRKPKKYKVVSCFLLGMLFLLLGLHHAEKHLNPPADPTHIYNLVGQQQSASLDGILQEYPSVISTSSGPETRLLMQVKAIYQPSGQNPQIPERTRASGQVLLTLKGLLPPDLKPGDRFLVKTLVSRVSTYSTPGSFNYKKYLAYQSILIKGWIQSPNNIMKLHTVESSDLTAVITGLKYLPERIRYHISGFLDTTLPQPARGLYKAILIGDRNDVPASVLENFTGAGCIHILAISGMHMGLLALVIIASITWMLKRSTWLLLHAPVLKIAVSIALLPLVIYALIAGFNIPVQRALLMTIVFILAILFDRPGNLINHILLAALLILVWQPGAIFTASFQLSFSAVIAIALIYPLLHRFLLPGTHTTASLPARPGPNATSTQSSIINKISGTFLKWLLAGVALTGAAMLGTFPLLLFHFNRFSLVAPFTNLLVEPLICFWSLLIGLIASLCIPLFPALAKVLFATGSVGLIVAERVCAFFSLSPYASLWLPTPAPGEIILIYLFLLSAVLALNMTGKQRRYSLFMALFFLCSLVAVPAVTSIAKQSSDSASVTFLDVGHGCSVLLQLPGDKNILIDGGGAESDRFNIGERIIGPFLWHQKLSHLDAVVVTHPHADHYNGLPFILTRFHPKELWINGISGPDKEYGELLDLAGQLGIATRITEVGNTLFQAGSTSLFCIYSGQESVYPTDKFNHGRFINSNDQSLVLRLEINGKSFLFTADISAGLAERLSKKKKLKADVLMAPHHGSPSSMSRNFIKSVAPEYIAISAGRNNRFNFPAQSLYDLQKKGIEVLSTGRDGTITFNLVNGEITVSRYQVN
jgi:competence protein ComEC